MATVIRPELSESNKYWIDKHRHYELKHFCLQYPLWKKAYAAYSELCTTTSTYERIPATNGPSDITAKYAMLMASYSDKMELIKQAAMEADEDLYLYILKAVTEGLSYTYLKASLNIPCSRDTYYDRYRRFFWILNKIRG